MTDRVVEAPKEAPVPPFSPMDCVRDCPRDRAVEYHGWIVMWDGPMGCPDEELTPIPCLGRWMWWASGEMGDPIDDETFWVYCDDAMPEPDLHGPVQDLCTLRGPARASFYNSIGWD